MNASLDQFAAYLDRLGLPEGWMPVFDESKSPPLDCHGGNHWETLPKR